MTYDPEHEPQKKSPERRVLDVMYHADILAKHLDDISPGRVNSRFGFDDHSFGQPILPQAIIDMIESGSKLHSIDVETALQSGDEFCTLAVVFGLIDRYGMRKSEVATLPDKSDYLAPKSDQDGLATPKELTAFVYCLAFASDEVSAKLDMLLQYDIRAAEILGPLLPHIKNHATSHDTSRWYKLPTLQNNILDAQIEETHSQTDGDRKSITLSLNLASQHESQPSCVSAHIDLLHDIPVEFYLNISRTTAGGIQKIDSRHSLAQVLLDAIRFTVQQTPEGQKNLVSNETLDEMFNAY